MNRIFKIAAIGFVALIVTSATLVATMQLLPYMSVTKLALLVGTGLLFVVWLLISTFRKRTDN